MINVLLIDDERLARVELQKMLSEFPEINIVGEASNADEAIAMIEKEKPDAIFLDINMPEKTGFDLLQELEKPPAVIFTTAYDEYALKAFESKAMDYLLKPIESERLKEAIEKLKNMIEPRKNGSTNQILFENDQVFIRDGEKCWFIRLNEISHFESVGNYVRVHFGTFKPLIHRSLNALEDRLDSAKFFRVNRQEIINLNYVEKIEPYFSNSYLIQLKNGKSIEVSRRQAQKFRETFTL